MYTTILAEEQANFLHWKIDDSSMFCEGGCNRWFHVWYACFFAELKSFLPDQVILGRCMGYAKSSFQMRDGPLILNLGTTALETCVSLSNLFASTAVFVDYMIGMSLLGAFMPILWLDTKT